MLRALQVVVLVILRLEVVMWVGGWLVGRRKARRDYLYLGERKRGIMLSSTPAFGRKLDEYVTLSAPVRRSKNGLNDSSHVGI